MSASSAPPLHRFPMFRTSDSEELRRLASKLLGSVRLDLSNTDHFRTLVNLIELEEIGLAFAATSCGLTRALSDDGLWNACGDTGAAHPLLCLAAVLEKAAPAEVILMVGFGQGVDAVVIQVLPGIAQRKAKPVESTLARGLAEPSYVRYLSHSGLLDVDFGMRAERDNRTAHTVAYRKRRAITGFVGGRCGACGTIQFPRSRVCVNPDCRAADSQDEYRLADSTGRVKSFTEDWQAFSPRPPLIYGNVEFAGGGNLLMEMTDVAPGQLAAGLPVSFVFRIKDRDSLRGFRRYFWKAAPVHRG